MSAAIIVAIQNTNITTGGLVQALWMLQGIICLLIFMGATITGSVSRIDRAGKILVIWLIISIPLFMWLF